MIKYGDLDFCSIQTILLILQSIFIVCLLYYAISLYTNIVEREDDDNRFIKCSMTHILAFREHTDIHNSACQYSLFLKAFLIISNTIRMFFEHFDWLYCTIYCMILYCTV